MNPKICGRNLFIALSGITAVHAEMEIVATAPPVFRIVAAGESSPALQQLLANVNPWGLALHPDTGVVYFSDPTAGLIGSIDPADAVPTVAQIINRPGAVFHGIALDAPRNRLFFLDSANNSVNVVNLATLVETQIVSELGITRPNDIAYDPVRNWILFTESGADGIGIIKTDQPVANFQGIVNASTVGAWGIAVNPGDGTIYFSSHDNGAIYQLDPDTGVSTAFATGLKGPRGLKFDRFGRLFCLESGEARVVQVLAPGMTATAPVFGNATNGRAFLVFDGSDKDGDFLPDVWEKRFETSVLVLDGESDPDTDGRTAFDEFFFNASPATGADPAPVRTFTPLPGGGLSLSFHAPSTGYRPRILLSSDMENWQLWTGAVTQSVLPDSLYSTFQIILTDPEALGLDPERIFARLTGTPITP